MTARLTARLYEPPHNISLAAQVAEMSKEERDSFFGSLDQKEIQALEYDWKYWGRPKQIEPSGEWRIWLLMAGRGFGKSRAGAEFIRNRVESGRCGRVGLIARTAADARDVLVDGESGIRAVSPPWWRPVYHPTMNRLTWPNGAIGHVYSADEPDRLRGPQADAIWCDELAAWRYPEAFDQAMFGLRLGKDPRCCITTTPRPVPILIGTGRDGQRLGLLQDPTCIVTRGSSYENRANLAPAFFTSIVNRYEGTRLGRQELEAEVLLDAPGALWTQEMLDDCRWRDSEVPPLTRVVVAIDPAVSTGENSDETGIIVAGRDRGGHGYLLADYSGRYTPTEWAHIAVKAYHTHKADRLCAETNMGGAMVRHTLAVVDPNISYRAVHASRGKVTRAEPIAALYERRRVHHVGDFRRLEDQMASFVPDLIERGTASSPDRVDACVAEGSLITTERGDVPIELVRPGDRVLTRKGYRKVLATRKTAESAEVKRVQTTAGSFVATPDHYVFTHRGWIVVAEINKGDRLLVCQANPMTMRQKLSTIAASSLGDGRIVRDETTEFTTPPIARKADEFQESPTYTSKFGETRTTGRLSQPGTLFTTLTEIPLTTIQKIWSALVGKSTRNFTVGILKPQSTWRTWRKSVRSLMQQIQLPKDVQITQYAGSVSTKLKNRIILFVSTAVNLLRPVVFAELNFATVNAGGNGTTNTRLGTQKYDAKFVEIRTGRLSMVFQRPVRWSAVQNITSAGRADVYDLMIQDEHEFFADGHLVHNCVWALTDLLLGMQEAPIVMPIVERVSRSSPPERLPAQSSQVGPVAINTRLKDWGPI